MANGWFPSTAGLPYPPDNGQVSSPFFVGAWDLRWDDPSLHCRNSEFTVVGVNIYRSDASDRGPYRRINRFPVGGSFYRDQTTNAFIEREVVEFDTAYLSKGQTANEGAWTLCARNPIVKRTGQDVAANSPSDVVLEIDGKVIPVFYVNGRGREITLITASSIDPITERVVECVLPTPTSEVVISYYTNTNFVKTDLGTKTFYRLTTVAVDPISGTGLVETPLEHSPPLLSFSVESLDWIWKEAIRRNQWILQQGGERVKAFVRKTSGFLCKCGRDTLTLEFSGQPDSRCPVCFGTSFVGGYEGPYDIIIAPDDESKNIEKTMYGMTVRHQYEVWTSPMPVLTHRDFITKQTNERYSIGPVRRPSNRGMNLQQHFSIGLLDEKDIRYSLPIFGTDTLAWPETRTTDEIITGDPCALRHNFEGQPIPTGADRQATPMATDKDNIPDSREQRGRTPVWENTQY